MNITTEELNYLQTLLQSVFDGKKCTAANGCDNVECELCVALDDNANLRQELIVVREQLRQLRIECGREMP